MKVLKIKDIVRTISITHKFDKDKLIAINTSDVENGIMYDGTLTAIEDLKGQFKKTVQKGDILFSEIRPANRRFALVTKDDCADYVVSTKLMVLRKYNNEVDLRYFYYCLTNQPFLDMLQRKAENRIGSFPQITFDLLSEYAFPVPSLSEQEKIANIIFSLDHKIELNKQINDNLEAMAKQLYDYWFVQFDFPNEEGKPYKSNGGAMVWNEKLKREIPQGLDTPKIGDIEKNIITGKTPSCADEDNFGGDIPFVTIDDIRGNLFVFEAQRTLSTKGADSQEKKYLPIGSLSVSCIGTIGVMGFVARLAQTNQQINSIVFEHEYNKEFLYFSLKLYYENAKAKTGNVFANMSKEEFASIIVAYPPKQILQAFHNKVAPIFDSIKNNIEEINSLTKQRDELLPLLMNSQATINYHLSDD
jgi:type I restriction enzyme S subunit